MGSIARELPYGDRILANVLDELAISKPDHVLYRVARSNDISEGFYDLTSHLFANAVNRVATWIQASLGRSSTFETLAYIGPSDPRYYALVLGASKAGYKVLLCSPRNSLDGQLNLLKATDCNVWILPSQNNIDHILAARQMKTLAFPEVSEIFCADLVAPYPYDKTIDTARSEPLLVLHTSGSTGLPKPIILTQGSAATCDAHRMFPSENGKSLQDKMLKGSCIYSQMPLFHMAGYLMTFVIPIYYEFTTVLGPTPNTRVLESMLENQASAGFDSMFLAPSTIEDAVKTPSILSKFSDVKFIVTGGGPLSVAAGNKVVEKTVLTNILGSTECGWMQFFQQGKDTWNYFEPHSLSGFEFRPFTDDLYQLYVVRKPEVLNYQATFQTFPKAEEYTSGDLFSRHPTRENMWKYEGRSDDVIVLSNGEKVQPTTTELHISQHPLIAASMVVGASRFQTGVLLEPKQPVPESETEQFIDQVWPKISEANASAPAHARVDRAYVSVVEPRSFVRTDKGSIKRYQTVVALKTQIDDLYAKAESQATSNVPLLDTGSEDSFKSGVRRTVKHITHLEDLEDDQDILITGVDSLQIITIARQLKAGLRESGEDVDAGVLYKYPTISSLSTALYSLLTTGELASQSREQSVAAMQAMVEKYTKDWPIINRNKQALSGKRNVVLSGSTGSLGSYFLDTLINDKSVDRIWLLNRSTDAKERQSSWNAERGLSTLFADSRIQFLKADMSAVNLGLSKENYQELVEHATHIIHNQWQVDFNLTLPSFEPHIAGCRNLANLAAAASHPISLLFTSSVSTMLGFTASPEVPEKVITDLSVAAMGYGQSKLVAEVILARAAEAGCLNVDNVRVGQIAGPALHGNNGIWNKKEWLPTIVEASAYLGLVPGDLGASDQLDWIPVDFLSKIIVELLFSSAGSITKQPRTFHTVNAVRSSWGGLVSTIQQRLSKKAGSELDVVSFKQWLHTLRLAVEKRENADVVPGTKLLDFYGAMDNDAEGVVFDTRVTREVSETMRSLEGVHAGWMDLWLQQWGY